MVYVGRLCPNVQPLVLLSIMLTQKVALSHTTLVAWGARQNKKIIKGEGVVRHNKDWTATL